MKCAQMHRASTTSRKRRYLHQQERQKSNESSESKVDVKAQAKKAKALRRERLEVDSKEFASLPLDGKRRRQRSKRAAGED